MFLERFARFVFEAGLLNPRGKQSARSFGKQAYSITKATCFQHFGHTFWPHGAQQKEMAPQSGQFGANLAQLRANLGPTWGQVGANFDQLRPTWANFGPDAAATWPTWAQLGPTWGQLGPQEPSGGLQKPFSDPPRQDSPPSGGRFSHHSYIPASIFQTVL